MVHGISRPASLMILLFHVLFHNSFSTTAPRGAHHGRYLASLFNSVSLIFAEIKRLLALYCTYACFFLSSQRLSTLNHFYGCKRIRNTSDLRLLNGALSIECWSSQCHRKDSPTVEISRLFQELIHAKLHVAPGRGLNPFPSKGFPIDEWNRLALDRVKSISALSAHSAVKGLRQ